MSPFQRIIIDGEVLECDPPRRLVQTWHAYFDAATAAESPTRLTWELHDLGNGVTELTLTHELDRAPITNAITSGQANEGGGGWPWPPLNGSYPWPMSNWRSSSRGILASTVGLAIL